MKGIHKYSDSDSVQECVCVYVYAYVCVGGHLAALAKPTQHNIKSLETQIHKERNRL